MTGYGGSGRMSLKSVILVITLILGGGGGGYVIRDVQHQVTDVQVRLNAHDNRAALAIQDIVRDRQDSREFRRAMQQMAEDIKAIRIMLEQGNRSGG